MAMNPWGMNLDALQMMSNPLLRGFASQQQEEEEPVGFWNKIASRMPGYNLPGMQNDMKRQALNEALIMAGASMMQNAGSGNIGSAIAEALTKGMGTYKEGVASQYQGLQEQRKREMEDLENAREARRLGISEEQLAIMKSGEERASTEFERESEEWTANAPVREAAREEAARRAAQARAAETYSMDEIYGMLTPQEKALVEATRVAKGAPAAFELAQEFYKNKLQAELEMKKTNAIASRYYGRENSSGNEIPTSIVNKLYTSAQNAMKELNQVLAKPPGDVRGNKTKEVAWRNAKTSEILGKYGWGSEEEVATFLSDYKARGGIGSAEEMPGLTYANPEFEAKKKELERLIGVAKASGRAGLKAEGLEDSDIDKVMMIAGVR